MIYCGHECAWSCKPDYLPTYWDTPPLGASDTDPETQYELLDPYMAIVYHRQRFQHRYKHLWTYIVAPYFRLPPA